MNKKISEPAFPCERIVMSAGYKTKEREPVAGMTLRDYFAAKVLMGRCTLTNVDFSTVENVAKTCYRLADAMLKARES